MKERSEKGARKTIKHLMQSLEKDKKTSTSVNARNREEQQNETEITKKIEDTENIHAKMEAR